MGHHSTEMKSLDLVLFCVHALNKNVSSQRVLRRSNAAFMTGQLNRFDDSSFFFFKASKDPRGFGQFSTASIKALGLANDTNIASLFFPPKETDKIGNKKKCGFCFAVVFEGVISSSSLFCATIF